MYMQYGQSVDTYAFAVTMCELLTHERPWRHLRGSGAVAMSNEVQICDAVLEGRRPRVPDERAADAPKGWITLMQRCWVQEAETRPAFDEIYTQLEAMRVDHEGRQGGADDAEDISFHTAPPKMGTETEMVVTV